MRRNSSINNTVPAMANRLATVIFTSSEAEGINTINTSNPRLADCVVPASDGSTKRFCVNNCMIKPDTLMALPASSSASVRGTRLIKKISRIIGSRHTASRVTRPAPTNRLATIIPANRINTADK
uniref:Uncharacterized protein n=1 Tax=Bracon brevicornis TaxID=1563983 RepID=A0A6V7KDS4_9HYME